MKIKTRGDSRIVLSVFRELDAMDVVLPAVAELMCMQRMAGFSSSSRARGFVAENL